MHEEIFKPLAADPIIKPGVCCCCCLCYNGDTEKDDIAEDTDREGTWTILRGDINCFA